MVPKYFKEIQHKGMSIYYFDMQNMPTPEYIDALHESLAFLKQIKASNLLLLLDGRNTQIFGEAFREAAEFGKQLAPFRKKTALLGATVSKKIMLNSLLLITGTSARVRTFDDFDLAKDWLVA